MRDEQLVWLWWGTLCVVSAFNVLAWLYAATRTRSGAGLASAQRIQLALSSVYVMGCAFRSALPRVEALRLVFWDHWLSNAALGRSVATLAELAFAAQWALLTQSAAKTSKSKVMLLASRALLPLIFAAEACSWYATITTNQLGGVIEESIWALSAALICIILYRLALEQSSELRRWFFLCSGAAAGFFVFLVSVDVPLYFGRWIADRASDHQALSIAQGWSDASQRWLVTRRWEDWRSEVVWMTGYFSLGVWMSIALTRVAPETNIRGGQRSGQTPLGAG